MSQTSIELVTLNRAASNEAANLPDTFNDHSESRTTDAEFSLPPVDGGRKAWLFLAACWVVEAVTFGELLWFYFYCEN
jgi:hypothetical protein